MSEDYYPGKGCKCGAWDRSECGCDVDWTPTEVYDLRSKLKAAHSKLVKLQREVTKKNNQIERLARLIDKMTDFTTDHPCKVCPFAEHECGDDCYNHIMECTKGQ